MFERKKIEDDEFWCPPEREETGAPLLFEELAELSRVVFDAKAWAESETQSKTDPNNRKR